MGNSFHRAFKHRSIAIRLAHFPFRLHQQTPLMANCCALVNASCELRAIGIEKNARSWILRSAFSDVHAALLLRRTSPSERWSRLPTDPPPRLMERILVSSY